MTATETRVNCPFGNIRSHYANDSEFTGITSKTGETRRKLSRELVEEVHPSAAVARRDERIRTVAKSFEEIMEGEEEEVEEVMSPSTSTSPTSRSPYALPPSECSPFSQRRSMSVTNHHPLVSPKFSRRIFAPRLQRGFSDPIVRRKSSLPTYPSELLREGGSLETLAADLLCLPPIPEATTPASPSTQHSGFKEIEDSE